MNAAEHIANVTEYVRLHRLIQKEWRYWLTATHAVKVKLTYKERHNETRDIESKVYVTLEYWTIDGPTAYRVGEGGSDGIESFSDAEIRQYLGYRGMAEKWLNGELEDFPPGNERPDYRKECV